VAEAAAAASDGALVTRTLAGDGRAFGELHARHAPRVARFVRFRVNDPESAEDLTQEIFMRAVRGLAALEDPELFGGWLLRIAHNLVCNFWRSTASRPRTVSIDAPPDASWSERAAEPAVRPIGDVESRVAADEILARAAALTELQQEVLSLRFVAGLSLRETADILGRSENAVKQLQYRAVTELRQRLEERL
jgi:RNA polymerase sigma-70 factor (ECF subfamily)